MLSPIAKSVLTTLGIYMLFDVGKSIVVREQLRQMLGEQNIDKKLADRLEREFKAQYQLQTKFQATDGDPEYDPKTDTILGRTGNRKETRLSMDDPANRLHELGHALNVKNKSWHAGPLYSLGRRMGQFSSAVASVLNRPVIAAVLQALGYAPILVEEWRASRTAREFVNRTLKPEEAERVSRMLDRAYRTYIAKAVSSSAAVGTSTWATMLLRKEAAVSNPPKLKLTKSVVRAIATAFHDAGKRTYEIPDYKPPKRKRRRNRRAARDESEER